MEKNIIEIYRESIGMNSTFNLYVYFYYKLLTEKIEINALFFCILLLEFSIIYKKISRKHFYSLISNQ
jgi:hypothetical protein